MVRNHAEITAINKECYPLLKPIKRIVYAALSFYMLSLRRICKRCTIFILK